MWPRLLEALHLFFFFLGTDNGTLLVRLIELIFFLLITYMISSEWLRTREQELKYLAFAFGIFSIEKFLLSLTTWLFIFGGVTFDVIPAFLPVVQFGLEMLAIVLLVNAFGYPLFRRVEKKFLGSVYLQVGVMLLFMTATQISWLQSSVLASGHPFLTFWGGISFTLIGMTYLLVGMAIVLYGGTSNARYTSNLFLAFLTYFLALLLRFLNVVIYEGVHGKLYVAEQPLPFLCALLFMRVVYLKLVDKATIIDMLHQSESKLADERKVSRMKDEFVSTVSHELRTPLTSIKLFVALLAQGKLGAIDGRQASALKTIKDESDRLANLIDELLDLAKLESGKASLSLSPFTPYEFLHDNIHYELAKEKGIKVGVKAPKTLSVRVDVPKFKQVFINLLSNAVKFTESGGTIIIEASTEGQNWSLSIADTGKGIEKEKIQRLFEKFYQTDDYMTRTQRGTGLGLAISKKIVELHKGAITVSSEPGKGSTFTVILPLDPPRTAPQSI